MFVKESCWFVRSVSGTCSSPRASRTQRGPLVEICRHLSLRSLICEEEIAYVVYNVDNNHGYKSVFLYSIFSDLKIMLTPTPLLLLGKI